MRLDDWRLRRATGADLTAIITLERAIFPTDAWSEATMLADLTNPDCFYLIAEQPDPDAAEPATTVGYAGLLGRDGTDLADIQTLAVASSARRKGLGRVLLSSLLAEAARRSVGAVLLEVRADNPAAENLYRSAGFRQIAVRRRYYQPDNVDAHIMRLELPDSAAPGGGAKRVNA